MGWVWWVLWVLGMLWVVLPVVCWHGTLHGGMTKVSVNDVCQDAVWSLS